jgi:NTP pyrophosphatase (non-canonical NTP hydrolase)
MREPAARGVILLTDAERLDRIAELVAVKHGSEAGIRQAVVLAEECGEAIGNIRRYLGHARYTVTRDAVAEELADVIISAQVQARLHGIDLDAAVNEKLIGIENRGGL